MKVSSLRVIVKDLEIEVQQMGRDRVVTVKCADGSTISWLEFFNVERVQQLTFNPISCNKAYSLNTLKEVKSHIETTAN